MDCARGRQPRFVRGVDNAGGDDGLQSFQHAAKQADAELMFTA